MVIIIAIENVICPAFLPFLQISGAFQDSLDNISSETAGIVKSRCSNGFTAGQSGVYSFYFENLESSSDKRMYLTFRSPYEPRFTVFGKPSLLMIVFGGLTLVCLMIWSGAKALFLKNSAPCSGNAEALPPHDHTLHAPGTFFERSTVEGDSTSVSTYI